MGGILDSSDTVLKGKIKSNYEVVDKMEDNSLSLLFKAKEKKTNNLVAIRVYMKQYMERIYGADKLEFAKKNLRKEIEYLKTCNGEYSLKLIDELEHQDGFNIVTELWDTTLEKHLINLGGTITIKEIKEIFSKLNIGLREMYNNDIIHGDLSLKNILVKYKDDDSIIPKISEYGKKIFFNDKLELMHTETYYSAPELLSGDKYNNKIDLWSIGVILYRLFFGEFPYKGKTQVAIYNQIMNQVPLKKAEKNDLFNDLISRLLKVNPKQRIEWEEYFSHEFWTTNFIEEDSESEESEMIDDANNTSLKKSHTNNINNSNSNLNNEELYEDAVGPDQKKKENSEYRNENENGRNRNKFCIFYSLNTRENSVEVNRFSITNILEEFPLEGRNKLKKMEIYLNSDDLDDDNNIDEATQETKQPESPKPLLSELILTELVKKTQNRNIYKLILYGCRLNEVEALNKPSFESLRELDLSNNAIDNLEVFSRPGFKCLTLLNLNNNKISNIDPLKKASFKSLLNLSLSNNSISNIDALSKVPFKTLDKLNLSTNQITDLEVFKSVPFKNLTYLNISDNQITDTTSPLSKLILPDLNSLDLSHNDIADISGLALDQYIQLKYLNLGKNKINNIEILVKASFRDINSLLLYDNQISDINVLSDVPFESLTYLNLSYNEISDINVLTNIQFSNLEKLDLSGNIINNINPFLKMPFNDLRELNVKNNKIEDNIFNHNVFEDLKKKYKYISIN